MGVTGTPGDNRHLWGWQGDGLVQPLDVSPWGQRGSAHRWGSTEGCSVPNCCARGHRVLGVSQEESTGASPHHPHPSLPLGDSSCATASGKDEANLQERGWGTSSSAAPSEPVTGTVWSMCLWLLRGVRKQSGALPMGPSGHSTAQAQGSPKGAPCPFLPRGGREGTEGRAGSSPPASSDC